MVTSVYDRNEYLSDKRAALNAWAGHISALGGHLEGVDNVVELRAGGGVQR